MSIKKIAIVGSPNVGKSSIFNNLTGSYATVSNYPGTTVEVFKASMKIMGVDCEIIDTPGMYSFLPLSEEERIARLIILNNRPDLVIHVGAAKNLERTLQLTIQLIEAGLPVILVLNIFDEAKNEGLVIDLKKLEEILGIPVLATVSVRNQGIKELFNKIADVLKDNYKFKNKRFIDSGVVYDALRQIIPNFKNKYFLSKDILALLLLQNDEEIFKIVAKKEGVETIKQIKEIKLRIQKKMIQPLEYIVNLFLRDKARGITKKVIRQKSKKGFNLSSFLGDVTLKPLVGIPILAGFLYFGIYKLVGEFGAGYCVDFLETEVFEKFINPFFIWFFNKIIPYEWLSSLFVGAYGIITLGIRYAVAIVLPIVGIFFLVFSFAEDTGYLPRLGAMLDRLFKKIGLSGRAVIPMVLGLGCATMATMVTRILPTKRERVIATFLLSLSVPCSAQLGVIMAVLSSKGWALIIWFFIITVIFMTTGFFLNRMLKGSQPTFHIELPPLRMPRLRNIFIKTLTRLKWYLKEVLPIFIWASVAIWLGQITGVFKWVVSILFYPVRLMGLPDNMAEIFLFGFFRRDYGAAGLYDLDKQGLLSVKELLIAAVVLTLFLPCIAQFLMNIKERGMKMAMAIAGFILLFSFGVGMFLNIVLTYFGVN